MMVWEGDDFDDVDPQVFLSSTIKVLMVVMHQYGRNTLTLLLHRRHTLTPITFSLYSCPNEPHGMQCPGSERTKHAQNHNRA